MKKVKQTSMEKTPIPVENAARILCSQVGWSELTEPPEEPTEDVLDASLKYRAAKRDPADVYDHPKTVAQDETLNNLQKMEILQAWALKTVDLQRSRAEQNRTAEIILLSDIVSALKELVEVEQSSGPEQVNYGLSKP